MVHNHVFKFDALNRIIVGNNRVISTSKIRKITVIRKNRSEKGIREDDLGSKPHSNGVAFSRSTIIFFESNEANVIIIVVIVAVNISIVVII